MKTSRIMQFSTAVLTALAVTPALAEIDSTGPIPIGAEESFDAVATGCIGGECYGVGKVVLVDMRTASELDFQGGPAKVDSIELKDGTVFTPDMGKTKVTKDGKFLEYSLDGKKKNLKVDKLQEVVTSLISKQASCSVYTPGDEPGDGEFVPDPVGFSAAMEDIADEMDAISDGPNVAITFCNSGGRSTQCPLNFLDLEVQDRFVLWYEIDAPGDQYITPEAFGLPIFDGAGLPPPGIHMATLGGYSGSSYGGDYNGNVGWPERQTENQPPTGWVVPDPDSPISIRYAAPSGPSVSWKDSGLPVYIPKVVCNLEAAPD